MVKSSKPVQRKVCSTHASDLPTTNGCLWSGEKLPRMRVVATADCVRSRKPRRNAVTNRLRGPLSGCGWDAGLLRQLPDPCSRLRGYTMAPLA